MAARKCPYCLTSIRPVELVTHSYDLVCPGCERPLELSRISRNFATLVGLLAGLVIWYWATKGASLHQAIGWVLPTLYSLIVFGVVAALMLMTTGDLSLKQAEDLPPHVAHVAAHADHTDDLPHHGGGHGAHGSH
jgi:hypothetical protein